MFRMFKKSKIRNISLFVFSLALMFFLVPRGVFAASGVLGWLYDFGTSTIYTIVSTVLYWPIHFLGKLTSLLIIALVTVAKYNSFLDQQGVTIGWTVVRDLANMFVVLGILAIGVGTLFNLETYSYKKLLPKLILAAVAVNFSKMLIGFLIDISQVITLTFVHGFEQIAAGNLVSAIGIDKMLSLRMGDLSIMGAGGDDAALSVLSSLLLGIVVLVVTVAIIVALVVYFVGRIVILWVAIIVSPLLFVLPVIPSGDKFSSQIWNMVTKQLFSGPVVAFFLWLSFLIMNVLKNSTEPILVSNQTTPVQFQAFASSISTVDGILNFIVVIGLLVTSLMMASQMGAAGGKFAGEMAGKLQQGGKKMLKSSALGLGRAADRGFLKLQGGRDENKRISLRPSIWKKAWADRSERKEKRLYGAVTAGMTDKLAAKEDAGKAYRGYRAEKERKEREEMSSMPGANNPKMQIAQIKSKLIKKNGQFTLKDNSDAPAVAASLLELAKQGELATAHADIFGEALNNENFEQLFRRLIPHDQKYADEIGSRAQRISQENGSIQYTRYGAQFKDGKAQIVLVDDRDERVREGIAIAEEGTGNISIRVANPNRYVKVDEHGNPTNEFEEGGAKRFTIDAAQYIANPGSSKKKTREWAVSPAGRGFLENGLRAALQNGEIEPREYDLAISALESLEYFNSTGYKRQRGGQGGGGQGTGPTGSGPSGTGPTGGPAGGYGGRRGGGGQGTGPTGSGPSGTGPNLSVLASRMKEASKRPLGSSPMGGGSSDAANPDDDEEDEEDEENTKI
ncbi:hypothetical protein GYA54_00615 [Candidatus Kuenenbacteria bacterium]|nr:hypothetical protein [Candidatus Kuenenbacteria bacterium]